MKVKKQERKTLYVTALAKRQNISRKTAGFERAEMENLQRWKPQMLL